MPLSAVEHRLVRVEGHEISFRPGGVGSSEQQNCFLGVGMKVSGSRLSVDGDVAIYPEIPRRVTALGGVQRRRGGQDQSDENEPEQNREKLFHGVCLWALTPQS